MCRCRRISSATTATPIAIATRRSSRGRADRLRRPRQACISRLRSWPRCAARGVEIAEITLHVGYGTFQPVRVEHVEDHRIEPERYEIGRAAADAINSGAGRRAADRRRRHDDDAHARSRRARARRPDRRRHGMAGLFIYPGFVFRVVSGLLTNFHLPQIVAADAGGGLRRPRARPRGVPHAQSPNDTGSTATATRCSCCDSCRDLKRRTSAGGPFPVPASRANIRGSSRGSSGG